MRNRKQNMSYTHTHCGLTAAKPGAVNRNEPQVVIASSCVIYHSLTLSDSALKSWQHILCGNANKSCHNRIFIPALRPQLSRIDAIQYCVRYLVLYQRYDKMNNTICFRISFPVTFMSGSDTSDHKPIQKRTGSRYLI